MVEGKESLSGKWEWWLACVVAVGAFLRLWHVNSQLLLDDEWHALNFVLERSFPQVILQQGLGANSIPVNIYSWLTLHTVGWSETILRLPSLVSGILALIIIPLLVKRLWGPTVALLAAFLMAVSPILIFYSRVARPYGPIMLLAPVSVLLTLAWIRDGKRRDMLLSAISGAIAVYYHLYAVIPVVLPMGVAALASLPSVACLLSEPVKSPRPFKDLFIAGGLMAVVVLPLVVLPNLLFPWWTNVQGMDEATWDTALTAARLLAGSYLVVPGILSVLLLLFGMRLMIRASVVSGVAYVLPFVVFVTIMSVTTQDGAHAGIQAGRYGISFFPLAFIAIAIGVRQIGGWSRQWMPQAIGQYASICAAIILLTPAVATSPLWRNYSSPNNFTGHSAFQYRYQLRDWSERSPERDLAPGVSMAAKDMPKLYLDPQLGTRYKGIIEFPMLLGDHYNVLYYLQHFHHLPVVAGYFPSVKLAPYPPGRQFVVANYPLEYVLGSVPEIFRTGMRWRTMVNLEDPTERQKYRGWLLVSHLNPIQDLLGEQSPEIAYVPLAEKFLTQALGMPVYGDTHITAWELK